MNITDSVSVSKNVWWMVGIAILAGMLPIGAVLYKSAPTSWYWHDLDSDVRILITVLGFLILIWTVIVYVGVRARVFVRGDRHILQARIEPFMRKNRIVQLDNIESIRIRKFNAVGDFGGIGFRKTFGKVTAYVLSFEGRALEIKLKDGKE